MSIIIFIISIMLLFYHIKPPQLIHIKILIKIEILIIVNGF